MSAPPPLDPIRNFLKKGEVEAALEQLHNWLGESGHGEKQIEVQTWQVTLSTNLREYSQGMITQEVLQTRRMAITRGMLVLLSDLDDNKPALHDYHSHTCDRLDQERTFKQYLSEAKDRRVHFYYLYGGDLHSHTGMFRRIALDLEGLLYDYLDPDLPAACRAIQLPVIFEGEPPIGEYRTELIASLFAAFGLNPNQFTPLRDRRLDEIVERSPKVQGLTGKDYVCISIQISEWNWYPTITPQVATWFIREFCQVELPADKPKLIFFFSVEYDEDNVELIGEIKEAIEKGEHILALPELDKVNRRDVAKWFERYKKLAPDPRERRKMIKDYFGTAADYYMIDVEEYLLEIIENYNNQRL